jgi:hypothetical protein
MVGALIEKEVLAESFRSNPLLNVARNDCRRNPCESRPARKRPLTRRLVLASHREHCLERSRRVVNRGGTAEGAPFVLIWARCVFLFSGAEYVKIL